MRSIQPPLLRRAFTGVRAAETFAGVVNRLNLNGDDKLQALFGANTQATMFNLAKCVNQHLP